MESEASVAQHLLDEAHQVSVQDGLQQLEVEPDGVIHSCEVRKYNADLTSSLEVTLDVLCKKGDLICC